MTHNVIYIVISVLILPIAVSDEYKDDAVGFGGKVGSLTDYEMHIKDNYVHEGLSQRLLDNGCKYSNNEDNRRACEGKSAEVFSNGNDSLVEAASKAYSMFMGMAAPDMELRQNNSETKKENNLKDSSKSKSNRESRLSEKKKLFGFDFD